MALGHLPLREIIAGLVSDRAREHPHIAFVHDVETLAPGYDDTVDLTLYRCVQESLTNAIRHANAKSIEVRVSVRGGALDRSPPARSPLASGDLRATCGEGRGTGGDVPSPGPVRAAAAGRDGTDGAEPQAETGEAAWLQLTVRDDGLGIAAGQAPGFGLRGMQERVQALGGGFAIEAGDGRGTCVCIVIPLPQSSGAQPAECDGGPPSVFGYEALGSRATS